MNCRLCAFAVELDDVVLMFPSGRVICVRCLHHECDAEAHVPAALARQLATPEEALLTTKLGSDARMEQGRAALKRRDAFTALLEQLRGEANEEGASP